MQDYELYGWNDIAENTYDELIPDGIYDFIVMDSQESHFQGSDKLPECDSALIYFKVQGKGICERFPLVKKLRKKAGYFLASVNALQGEYTVDKFPWFELLNTKYKTGKCYITSYKTEHGQMKNKIAHFCIPGEDLRLTEWTYTVYKRDNYTCQLCGSNKNLHAHHILSKSFYPDKKYDVTNGQCLCNDCHHKVHKNRTFYTGDDF